MKRSLNQEGAEIYLDRLENTENEEAIRAIAERMVQWLKENPKKVDGWLNIYGNDRVFPHDTREEADRRADDDIRIACIPISYTVGEGLEDD